jgi:hypothetical protein
VRVIWRCAFLALCAIAAWLPAVGDEVRVEGVVGFPGWPAEWEGELISAVPLSESDVRFNRRFPGRIAKFTDGRRDLIFRWVTHGTRQLHGSADCFRGMGYTITPQPAVIDARRGTWSRFSATRGRQRLIVRERITDEHGGEWTDVSAWYWSALLRQTRGPWMAVTVAEKAP